MTLATVSLFVFCLTSCNSIPSGFSQNTFVNVPDRDFAIWNEKGQKLNQWSFSSERAGAVKLTYRSYSFFPELQKQRLKAQIEKMPVAEIVTQTGILKPQLTLLNDGRVLLSGGFVGKNGHTEISSSLFIVDSKKRNFVKLGQLQIPRNDHSVVQLQNGLVLFFGGATEPKFASDGTTNLTDTVEQLNLRTRESKILGTIMVARHGVIAEVISDHEILIVGGWNERFFNRDERWWTGAEIFKVPMSGSEHNSKEH